MGADDETLRTWAMERSRVGLTGLAGDPTRFRNYSKEQLIDWLLTHKRADLAESHRVEIEALSYPRHNHQTRGIRRVGECPACDRYHAQQREGTP